MDSSFVERGAKGEIGCTRRSIPSGSGKQLYGIAASTAGELAMGIGWLRHFTHTDGPDTSRVQNENRAAAFHVRWHALCRLATSPERRLRDAYRERSAARELDALTDDVLGDVGLRRDVDGHIVAAPREWNRRHGPATDASPSISRRPRLPEPGDATGFRRGFTVPSSTDRPTSAPRHDESGRRAA